MSYLGDTKLNDYENGIKFLGLKVASNEVNDTKEKDMPSTDPAATGFGGAGPQHPAVQQQQQIPQATAAAGGIPQPPMMHLVNTINGPMLVPVSQNPHLTQPPPPVSSVERLAYFFVFESFLNFYHGLAGLPRPKGSFTSSCFKRGWSLLNGVLLVCCTLEI